ncbi:putative cytochrome c class I protein, probably cytochrome c4 [Fulvimarina pelagi HTCC2506]|uniref:Putative cytochrome c class I protein, probably cytochrome c4 n=1 Tax=Fulvimarina pelagi HTCC2506 TaxID=314231 RepID=Q0G3S7_9HYPH|nr:c-type cytochrome [Fulvimarina pelagi]EAU41754.1 putative cytochrome c class I protein, probably cytochrome c4 [Fulvimarina pelagi HTCC2506]
MKKRIAIDFVLTWKKLAAAGLGAIMLALAVSFSGMVSIAASSGHFGPVGWFLHWTMQNAVARQSLGIAPPEDVNLADPALVQRASGHFATGCAPCHGAPGVPQSPVVESMMPAPPRLEEKVAEWKDRELFWIGLHGIKYSGMPAWPTQDREDEIWSIVAFLRALPELSAERYAELALGGERENLNLQAGGEQTSGLDGIVGEALADCARCHGRDGLGRGEGESARAFPIIAGQPETYLAATLEAYAKGYRHSGYMQPPASRYPEDVLRQLAAWYAEQPVEGDAAEEGPEGEAVAGVAAQGNAPAFIPASTAADGIPPQIFPSANRSQAAYDVAAAAGGRPEEVNEAMLELGRLLAEDGIAARKLPACDSCHDAKGRMKNAHYPYLAGQPAWYTEAQLKLWKDHDITRGGTRYSHLMTPIAENLTDEQIKAVAAWYESRPVGE